MTERAQSRSVNSIQTGERFGRLTVTEIGHSFPPSERQAALGHRGVHGVLTSCDCGRTRFVRSAMLLSARIESCGSCNVVSTAALLDRIEAEAFTTPESRTVTTNVPGSEATANNVANTTVVDSDLSRTEPCRGGGRRLKVIDTAEFEPLVAEFLQAAAIDGSYAVSICEAAVRISGKRVVWSARNDLRAAEKTARTACAASTLTSCEIQNPCGTGLCAFTPTAELRQIDVPAVAEGVASKTRATRPQPRIGPGYVYTTEGAVPLLLALREANQDRLEPAS